jgi:hypothetical protein
MVPMNALGLWNVPRKVEPFFWLKLVKFSQKKEKFKINFFEYEVFLEGSWTSR